MEALELIKQKGARKVFETLLKFKGRQFTMNELAKEAHVPFVSVWRLVKIWDPAGIVETSVVGRSKIIKFRDSEYTKRILELLKLSVSPQSFTADALKKELKNKGIIEAHLFGSVAKGNEKLESDIDIAILAGRKFDANKLVFDIYERYGTKIVPLIFENKQELDEFLKDKGGVKIV